jgi:hypothetical protein
MPGSLNPTGRLTRIDGRECASKTAQTGSQWPTVQMGTLVAKAGDPSSELATQFPQAATRIAEVQTPSVQAMR